MKSPIPVVLILVCLTVSGFAQMPVPKSILNENVKPVTLSNGIAATLALPYGEGPFPAVILVAPEGSVDENMTLNDKFRPYERLSRSLNLEDMAVLRITHRGLKNQGGTATEVVADIKAGIDFLASHAAIHDHLTGLVGHGLGGWLAMEAAKSESVAFLILMATPMEKMDTRGLQALAAKEERPLNDLNWYQLFDPKQALQEVECSVMGLYGAKDLWVPPHPHGEALLSGLKGNKNYKASANIIPNAGHFFHVSGSETFYPGVEETVVFWIKHQIKSSPSN